MSTESVVDPTIAGEKRTRRLDRGVAGLADAQHGVVGRRQLLGLGLSGSAIDHRIEGGRLHLMHRGIYSVGHTVVSREGRWMAAVLAGGPGVVLSHRSAAALWGIRGTRRGPIDITVPRKSNSSKGIRRHRAQLPADEVTTRRGIPVTTVPRTLFDLAAGSSVDEVENALRESEYQRFDDRLSLPDLLARYPGRRGATTIRECLARRSELPPGRTRSPLEERFLPFLERYRLPRPQLNAWLHLGEHSYEVDCLWADLKVIVELDSWAAHGTRAAFRSDRTRDRVLRVAGYEVTRLTWSQLDDEPRTVAVDLRSLLAMEA